MKKQTKSDGIEIQWRQGKCPWQIGDRNHQIVNCMSSPSYESSVIYIMEGRLEIANPVTHYFSILDFAIKLSGDVGVNLNLEARYN